MNRERERERERERAREREKVTDHRKREKEARERERDQEPLIPARINLNTWYHKHIPEWSIDIRWVWGAVTPL